MLQVSLLVKDVKLNPQQVAKAGAKVREAKLSNRMREGIVEAGRRALSAPAPLVSR